MESLLWDVFLGNIYNIGRITNSHNMVVETKKLVLVFIALLFIPFSSAMTFYQDTNITQGNTIYTFTQGLNFTSMEVLQNGLRLDGVVYRFVPQGGTLHITIHEWESIDRHLFSMESNVEQTIQLGVMDYYFFDGDNYHKGEYHLTERTTGSFQRLSKTEVITTSLERVSWARKSFVEYEYRTVNKDGIIYSDITKVDNLTIVLFLLLVIVLIIFWVRK